MIRSWRSRARQVILGSAAAFAALFSCGVVHADPVTVTGTGGLAIKGEVRGFDGRILRLHTEYGEVSLDYERVTCDGAACPDPDAYVPLLRLAGSARMAEVLVPALIEAFARDTGRGVTRIDGADGAVSYEVSDPATGRRLLAVQILPATTAQGFAALARDEADMVMAVREPTPVEIDALIDSGRGDVTRSGRSRILGFDAVLPIASPFSRIEILTDADLAAILTGAALDWSDLSPTLSGEITLHLGPVGTGHEEAVLSRLIGDGSAVSAGRVIRHATWSDLSEAVAADRQGVGLTVLGEVGRARTLSLAGDCGRMAPADRAALKAEDYPLVLPLFLYAPVRRVPPEVQALLDWLDGDGPDLVVRRAGFADRAPEAIPVDAQGRRLAEAILAAGEDVSLADLRALARALRAHDRLTPTFRFEVGSTRLDAQSRGNLRLVADRIAAGDYRGRRLVLVGFSDARGPAEANGDLALARADAVRRALVAELGGEVPPDVILEIDSFGEALPMGCDTSELGRQINRRVELWIARE